MTLSSILNTSVGALQVHQTALRVTSGNIANVNTEGYHRRVVELSPRLTGSELRGVALEEIRRINDIYLMREALSAAAQAADGEIRSGYLERVQSLMGSLEGGNSLGGRIDALMSAFQQAAVEPSSAARRNAALSQLDAAMSWLNRAATDVQALRQDVNNKLSEQVTQTNTLLRQISELNDKIKIAVVTGDTASGHLDERDRAIATLAQIMDVKVLPQPDGRYFVATQDGQALVSDMTAQLSYVAPAAVATSTSFPTITIQRFNLDNGAAIGSQTAFEPHLDSGSMRGLIDLRDSLLPDLAEQLGLLSGGLAEGLNAIHNAASAVPAAQTLTGINSGLLSSDAHGFTGRTTLAVTDATGALVRRIDVDFDAGTLSVNGAGAGATGATIGSVIAALNGALGGDGTAVLSNGVLTVQATVNGNGVSFAQDPAVPSQRGGRGFAQVFGLNDLVRASVPTSGNTGFTAGSAHGFTAGGQLNFVLRGANGAILTQAAFSVAGAQVSDIVNGLNAAMGGQASVSLDANGALVMNPSSGVRMEIISDTTARGATGVSLSAMFGLGTAQLADRARTIAIRGDIQGAPQKLALAQLDLSAPSVPGTIVLGASDNRAGQALGALAATTRAWGQGGGLTGVTLSLADFAGLVNSDQARKAQAAQIDHVSASDIATEVATRRAGVEGVNMDEELSNMIVFQQAYNAAARMITTVQEMFDTLLSTVGR